MSTLWFVPIKDKNERIVIQSIIAASYDEAVIKVLEKPLLENVVAYCKMTCAADVTWTWINIDEQNQDS